MTTIIVFVGGGGKKVSVGRIINVGATVADASMAFVLVGKVTMLLASVRPAAAVWVSAIA